jgi:hypothetical protein
MHDGVHQEALRIDENMPLLAFDFLSRVIAMRIDATPPHMGCVRSSLFTSELRILLGVRIRSVSPPSPCSRDGRITSHPVELYGLGP